MENNILITGIPKSGKSTMLERVLNSLAWSIDKKGFMTREIKEGKERMGFNVITSTGNIDLLSSIYFYSPIKVGRYFVEVPKFEKLLPEFFDFKNELLYIDEIGQMQLYSSKFENLVRIYLDSQNLFLGTLSSVYSHPLIDEIKNRKDSIIFNLTPENREEVFEKIQKYL